MIELVVFTSLAALCLSIYNLIIVFRIQKIYEDQTERIKRYKK